jgi:hypothetical protein
VRRQKKEQRRLFFPLQNLEFHMPEKKGAKEIGTERGVRGFSLFRA